MTNKNHDQSEPANDEAFFSATKFNTVGKFLSRAAVAIPVGCVLFYLAAHLALRSGEFVFNSAVGFVG